jgi:molybdopterin-guanine dinucleotide biosynthesis protein A
MTTARDSEGVVDCCAIVLAGGLNTRMGGHNKAFLNVGGKRILDRITEVLAPIFNEILLVTREPELYQSLPFRVVEDIFKVRSSLTGIHAGLTRARASYGLVVPCDAPFLRPELIRILLNNVTPEVDVVVPRQGEYYQPLCAVYSKRCLSHIEDMLRRGDLKIYNFFDDVALKTIPFETFDEVDPQQRSFININTPEMYSSLKDQIK